MKRSEKMSKQEFYDQKKVRMKSSRSEKTTDVTWNYRASGAKYHSRESLLVLRESSGLIRRSSASWRSFKFEDDLAFANHLGSLHDFLNLGVESKQ